MANVIIKSDERRASERHVARSFGVRKRMTPEQRDAIETIAQRSEEAAKKGKIMEERKCTR